MFNKKYRPLDFLIIGAQKSGTSALDHYLRQHPEIGMGKVKELHFFDHEPNFSGKKVDYRKYNRQIERKAGKRIFGECTPIYLYWKPVPGRIREYNANIKLISILRDPAQRAFSQWNMNRKYGWDTEDFMYCLEHEKERCRVAMPFQHVEHSYTDRGFYSIMIDRYREYFSDDQMLFIKYEDFVSSQRETVQKVLDFIGADIDGFRMEEERIFKSDVEREMTSAERAFLGEVFKDEIPKLEAMLNWDCSDWKV